MPRRYIVGVGEQMIKLTVITKSEFMAETAEHCREAMKRREDSRAKSRRWWRKQRANDEAN